MTHRPASNGRDAGTRPSTSPAELAIRRGRGDDVAATAEVVAVAFTTLTASTWLVPDPDRRRQVLTEVFTILVAHAFDHGIIHLVTATPPPATGHTTPTRASAEDVMAAAVWIDRTQPIPAPPDYERRLRVAAGRDVAQFARLDDLFAMHHPTETHHHLAFLAVDPRHQNRGLGTRLLLHHLPDLDAARTPAYLEAHGPRNQKLYARHGWTALDHAFELPNGATFQPMWRAPAPT